MKVIETYVITKDKLANIAWLKDFVLKRDFDRIFPFNGFHIVKVYKDSKDEWYVETPGFSFGNTTTVSPSVKKIPTELVNVKDLEDESEDSKPTL